MSSQSDYEAAAAAYWQPGDYFLVTGGVLAYDGETTPTGTVASIGSEYAQLDVGYRDRRWSPFQDSAMLLSTQARDDAVGDDLELHAAHARRSCATKRSSRR